MIGILALQGGFEAHGKHLTHLNQTWCYVRTAEEIAKVDGLIIPGGESTTLLKLMNPALEKAIHTHAAKQKPIFATCAGVILLASEVTPEQHSLALLHATVVRNAYGRQLESFSTEAAVTLGEKTQTLPMVFIRAPKIVDFAGDIKILARHNDDAVFVQQGNLLAATFHPELTNSLEMHRYFVSLVQSSTSSKPQVEYATD